MLCLLTAAILIATCLAAAQDLPTHAKEPLDYSCRDEPYVTVNASTPRHDTIPKVQLTLTDPLGRMAGRAAQGKRIPNSRYGKVTEIPSAPNRSLVLAIEVCNAQQGDYHIRIEEHGADPYRLTVGGESTKISANLELHHISKNARTLEYVFAYRIENEQAVVRWVDREREVPDGSRIEINDW